MWIFWLNAKHTRRGVAETHVVPKSIPITISWAVILYDTKFESVKKSVIE